MEYLLPYLCNIMVGLERMLDYRGVGLARFTVVSPHVVPPNSVEMWGQCCEPRIQDFRTDLS